MTNKYKNLRVHEVSLVDAAANKRKFAMLKSEDDPTTLTNGGLTPELNETSEESNMKDEDIQALVAAQVAAALKAQETALLEKSNMDKQDAINKAKDEAATATAIELKKRDDQIAELLKAEEIRKDAEFVTKAQSLSVLGVDAEFGKVLKAVSASCPAEYSKIWETLTKAVDTISKGALMKEVGSNGDLTQRGSEGKLDQLATELMAKDANLTKPQAIVKALDINPDLYTEYLKGE